MSEMCCSEGTNEMRDDSAAGEAIRSDDSIYMELDTTSEKCVKRCTNLKRRWRRREMNGARKMTDCRRYEASN